MSQKFLVTGTSSGVRDNLVKRLRELGHEVVLASTHDGAATIARDVAIDTAFIEDGGDSPVQADRLRGQILAERPKCRVIMLRSVAQERRAARLLNYGEPDYILTDREFLRAVLPEGNDPAGSASTRDGSRPGRPLIDIIDLLVSLLEVDDAFFAGFSHQVSVLVRAVGEHMGMDQDTLDELVVATLLRDLGKVGLKQQLLDTEDPFTPGEREQVKAHAVWTVRLLEHIDLGGKILPVVRHHHERYDGTGYPDGMRGRAIPLGARIITVCESFAAMLSDRPHRPAKSLGDAVDELMSKAGTQFDPEVVEMFMHILDKNPTVRHLLRKTAVLLVDPEPEFRRLLKIRLLNHGVHVRAISQVDGDLQAYLKPRPALLLVDSGADGVGPLEILHQMESLEPGDHIPVAVLARDDRRETRLTLLRHGVDDYLLKTDDLEETAVRVANILAREARRHGSIAEPRPSGVTGLLENLALEDIVQMLALGSKTASVTLRANGAEGTVWFREGAIVHASCGEVHGDEAFYEMMRWRAGEFAIRHGVVTTSTSVTQDAMFLLMEGLRRMDEESSADRDRVAAGWKPEPDRELEALLSPRDDPAPSSQGGSPGTG